MNDELGKALLIEIQFLSDILVGANETDFKKKPLLKKALKTLKKKRNALKGLH